MDRMPNELRTFAPALALLAVLGFINYVDRSNLSIAAPLLKDELRISASQLGILLSAFFWTYTAMQFVTGWVVDRFEVNRVIAAGFLLWSLATAAIGLVRGFAVLITMRLLLGIGESVMVPAWSKILSFHLEEHHRGFANGVFQGAVRFGPAVGTLAVGFLIAKYGWRPAFIGIGTVSLFWIPAWIRWMPRGKRMHGAFDATGSPSSELHPYRPMSREAECRFKPSYSWCGPLPVGPIQYGRPLQRNLVPRAERTPMRG